MYKNCQTMSNKKHAFYAVYLMKNLMAMTNLLIINLFIFPNIFPNIFLHRTIFKNMYYII